MVGVGGKHENSKTGLSVDFTTVCRRVREGRPCPYCYVHTQRKNGGYLQKTVIDYEPYDGFVLRLTRQMIRKLNRMGGIRMFSFGDYMPEHAVDIEMCLDDCVKVGLGVKVITKETEFIRRFHGHQAIKIIHLSIDNIGGPINHSRAQAYRRSYAKVAIRAAVMNQKDLENLGSKPYVDILTLNHAANGFHIFKRSEIRKAARQYPGRVCCTTHGCSDCPVRCGLDKRGRIRRKHGQE